MNEETTTAIDLAEAERFADALDRLEERGEAGLDPREDPTLTALTDLAAGMRGAAERAAAAPRFASYRVRSRASLLHRLALARGDAAPRRAPEPARAAHPLPFPLRWNVLSPIASAAAAAAIVLALVALQRGEPAPSPAVTAVPRSEAPAPAAPPADADTPAPAAEGAAPAAATPAPPAAAIPSGDVPLGAPPLGRVASETAAPPDPGEPPSAASAAEDGEAAADGGQAAPAAAPDAGAAAVFATGPRTIAQELDHIDELLAAVTARVESRRPVSADLLRGITESIAAVAYHIESRPTEVQREQVIAYIKAAADGRILLAAARTDAAGGAALSAARRVANDGVAVASWYFTYY